MIDAELIAALRAKLAECADDLAERIEAEYAGTLDYPSQKRKYDRDMALVSEARALGGETGMKRSTPYTTAFVCVVIWVCAGIFFDHLDEHEHALTCYVIAIILRIGQTEFHDRH